MRVMPHEDFERFKRLVGFDAASAAVLRELHRVARPHFESIVGDFYASIEADEQARQVLRGGAPQSERLRRSLARWLDSTLVGPHDEAYLQTRSRIGHVHVRIELPQHLMFTAMNRIRTQLSECAFELGDPGRVRAAQRAVGQVLDMELAIMLETYRADLQERIRAHERLSTIGQLAASIGHELRNPLGIIESSIYLMRQRLARGSSDGVAKHIDKVESQVRVCNTTITELLELARSRAPRKRAVQLRSLIEQAIEGALISHPEAIRIEADERLEVLADSDQLRQVLVNLIVNAEQAAKERAIVSPPADAEALGNPSAARPATGFEMKLSARAEAGGLELLVSDNGPGVAEFHRARIFEALFTTKARGTGLGLALCRRIMEAHRGEISLLETERGACFRLWFPGEPPASVADHPGSAG